MGWVAPFSAEEGAELERVARASIWGYMHEIDEPHAAMYSQITRAAINGLDRETGTWVHLPYSGGTLQQPIRTMQAFGVVQAVFGEKLKEEYSNGKSKS